ncbi:MAG: phosphotransferase [Phycisphaerae bacterium]|nr:phosphotransferase [Phycisphaerae bacterium]
MPSNRPRAEFEKAELVAVLSHYDLGGIERIDPLLKGSRKSPKLIITTDRGRYLLKRRAPGRDHVLKVAFSHAVQRYLAEGEFPLPRLQPTRDEGDTMLSWSDAIYEVFEYLPGGPFDATVEAACDAGRVLGLFHRLLEVYESDWEPSHTAYHNNNGVRTSLNGVPSAAGSNDSVAGHESELLSTVSRLFDVYDRAASVVDELGFAHWPPQIIHSDWHPGNMLFVNSRVSGVIDFDSLRRVPRVLDVANGALQFSILGGGSDPLQWPPAPDEARLRHFLLGYDETHALREEDVQALPYLMIEAVIAEAVLPIAATGSFGRMEGFRFLRMIERKAQWLLEHGQQAVVVPQR